MHLEGKMHSEHGYRQAIDYLRDRRPQNIITVAIAKNAKKLIQDEKNWGKTFYINLHDPKKMTDDELEKGVCRIDTKACSFCFVGAFGFALMCPTEGKRIPASYVHNGKPMGQLDDYHKACKDACEQLHELVGFSYTDNDFVWDHKNALDHADKVIKILETLV